MRYRVLGVLRVSDSTAWSGIRAAQQRIVLAILIIEAGRIVSIDRLIDEIWGDLPPSAAMSTMHGYVSRLRRLLGDVSHQRLVTSGHGYRLLTEDGDVDAAVFERLAASGRRKLASGELQAGAAELADALALWRGQPYADVLPGRTVSAEVERLEQARLSALEDCLGARLDLGEHADVVEQLARLTAEHPLRERFWLQRMLALHRCDRRVESLEAYQKVRRLFVEELGIEPGQALRELHSALLNDDARLSPPRPLTAATVGTVAVVPRQLPSDVPGFTGREAYLRRLDAMPDGDPPPRVVITGPAGVGKTALAVRWAHRVRDRFPDGQLYVDMRGYATDLPLQPSEVLGRFLRSLGVPPKEIPMEMEEAAALYRSLLSDRRVLVLVDNVRRPAQVRPLVPSGPGCLLVVTGRDRLDGFVARDGATRVDLGPLAAEEAQRLLASLVGMRSQSDAAASRILALQCGHLPLALRIAAARLASQPHLTLAEYSRQLNETGRLEALQVEDDPEATVRAAFDLSHATLSVAAQRLFHLLGLAPGPHIGPWATAALAALPEPAARALLDELTSAHLVAQEATDRFVLHDLLREYARELVGVSSREALDRYLERYLARATAAAERMYPHLLRLPSDTGGETFDDADAAGSWLDAERANLVAIATHAARHGPPRIAWRLADTLRGYLYLRMHTPEWRTIAQAGLDAAQVQGDPAAIAAARLCAATLQFAQGAHREAIGHYAAALESAQQAGWDDGVSAALGNLGNLHWALGDLQAADDHYRQALARYEQSGAVAHQATALGNLGLVYLGQGRLELAEKHFTMAMDHHRAMESVSGEARTLIYFGDLYRAQARWQESSQVLDQALALVRETGDRNAEGDTLRGLAATALELGRPSEGLELAAAAVELARATGDQRLEVGALTTLARLHQRLERYDLAVDGYRRAIRIAQEIGNRYLEADATVGLAESLRHMGDPADADDQAACALRLSQDGGYWALAKRARALLSSDSSRDGHG